MTTIYIIRHSKPFRNLLGIYNAEETEQVRNEKNPLCAEGEKLAEELSNCQELLNIDTIYSSQYVRAMSTAKYIAEKNNIPLNVDERLGERRFGVNDIKELPSDFFEKQFKDWDYKLPNGESINEVSKRMNEAITNIIDNNKNKRIVILSHGTAISSFLKTWCDIKLNENTKLVEIYFNNKLVFDGNWKCPEMFKLEFADNSLTNIENIKYNETR